MPIGLADALLPPQPLLVGIEAAVAAPPERVERRRSRARPMYWPCSIGVIVGLHLVAERLGPHRHAPACSVSTLNGSFVVLNANSMWSVPSSARHCVHLLVGLVDVVLRVAGVLEVADRAGRERAVGRLDRGRRRARRHRARGRWRGPAPGGSRRSAAGSRRSCRRGRARALGDVEHEVRRCRRSGSTTLTSKASSSRNWLMVSAFAVCMTSNWPDAQRRWSGCRRRRRRRPRCRRGTAGPRR